MMAIFIGLPINILPNPASQICRGEGGMCTYVICLWENSVLSVKAFRKTVLVTFKNPVFKERKKNEITALGIFRYASNQITYRNRQYL